MPRINPEYRNVAKKKIIAATLEIAHETGWDAVTLETVARKVGVTKGALYTYFENCDALMEEAAFELIKTLKCSLKTDSAGNEADIHEVLSQIADAIFTTKDPVAPIFMQALARAAQDAPFRERIGKRYDETLISLHEEFQKRQKAGQIPEEVDIKTAVRAIYGLTLGLAFIYHMLGKDRREAKKDWLESAERILLISPGTGDRL
ncbi:TetR/AcrR family transcriptional regulator [Methanoregula sp.]|jgi:AcrR family transcriptional regulator|uniref:TetR/AcrR family transcriptional regulator n=1 Tax=Methanoregula sp. TaxID=2052170 RepID=UPI003562F2E7